MLGSYRDGNVLKRATAVAMLQAALESGETRFARQTALAWLAAFPGDIEVSLLQARAMIAEGKPEHVIAGLQAVCQKDPFAADAYRVLASAALKGGQPAVWTFAVTSLYALEGELPADLQVEAWGYPLRAAVLAIKARRLEEAEKHVQDALRLNPDLSMAAAMHLLVAHATQEPAAVRAVAQVSHDRWPECLPLSLILAEAHLDLGDEPEAVRLLHLCAASDAAGQVAARLWGKNHRYRALWPEEMVILFDQPVPAGVAARLGWNILQSGPLPEPAPAVGEVLVAPEEQPVEAVLPEPEPEPAADIEPPAAQPEPAVEPDTSPVEAAAAEPLPAEEPAAPVENAPAQAAALNAAQKAAEVVKQNVNARAKAAVQAVEKEFERLAKRLRKPQITRTDTRFPVYVILSTRSGLEAQYGPQTAQVLDGEMRRLAAVIQKRPCWGAMVYYPDETACTLKYGLTPVNPNDPWKVKHALADLDGALAKQGEMIGAILIVGGDAVVPFHRVPNPTDDMDGEIPTDTPYASLDANYLVPEWPVGRLPGECGPDAGLILDQLRQMQKFHKGRSGKRSLMGFDWLNWLQTAYRRFTPSHAQPSFGYTAAVWRRSSLAVFRPIGAPHTVLASPPADTGSFHADRVLGSSLGYYNLHGLEDSPAWYGQRDPAEKTDAPDYPVAISPENLRRNGHAPRVIFSEACFGGHILGKTENQSMALKFLALGAHVVVGSTCVAYGSVSTPLVAADLLGFLFWQHMKAGRTAGEALMQARIDLVREMNRRQGFLDGEDQKTLVSFVLYGDPLMVYDGLHRSKALYRAKDLPSVRTATDQPEAQPGSAELSGEALKQVKQIVAEYLPGADLRAMRLSKQTLSPVEAVVAEEPARRGFRKNGKATHHAVPQGERTVVTVSKQVRDAQYIHKHYVRVTLDDRGRPVKLSISR